MRSTESAPLEDLADALRRLVDLVLRLDDDDPGLADVVALLDSLSTELEAEFAPGSPFEKMLRADVPRHDPVCGVENALALPLQITDVGDGSVTCTAEFGLPYQGSSGMVHDGVWALVLDHMLSMANGRVDGKMLVTAQLTMRQHQPVPLFEQCVITCWQTEADGRKVWARGEVVVNGVVAVSGEGLFIARRATWGDRDKAATAMAGGVR